MRVARRICGVVALIAIAGCSAPPKMTADQYYEEGTAAFADENHDVAISRYKELLDNYPFDDHAEEAELKIAEAYYHQGQYAEAIAAFNDFQRMHPMSPHLPQVYLMLGRSYQDQMTTIDRDQGAAENASGWYRTVLDRYPKTPEADDARIGLRECRASLADHELYIARFYFERENVPAGENRVKGILELYPETEAAIGGLEMLAKAYESNGDDERAERAFTAASELSAAFVADGPDGAIGLSPARASEPAVAEVLADLQSRYGTNQVTTTAAAPALADPTARPAGAGQGGGGPPGAPVGMPGVGMGRGMGTGVGRY